MRREKQLEDPDSGFVGAGMQAGDLATQCKGQSHPAVRQDLDPPLPRRSAGTGSWTLAEGKHSPRAEGEWRRTRTARVERANSARTSGKTRRADR